jgi:hypothetical protein
LSEVILGVVAQVCQEIVEPRSYAQAVNPSNAFHKEWHSAANRELKSLTDNHTWDLVLMPLDNRVIGSIWIFQLKRDSHGKVLKFKARVCARGDQQTYEIDYYETFAPTLHYTTLRVLLSLAYSLDLEIEQFDVVTAFLNVDVDEDIYMYPLSPNGTSTHGERFVCKLKRSLYGIKQAPRFWQALLSSWLMTYGFCQCKLDPSVYTLIRKDK